MRSDFPAAVILQKPSTDVWGAVQGNTEKIPPVRQDNLWMAAV